MTAGTRVAVEQQPNQVPRDAPVSAVADADDDLLADVTALCVADRVVQPGFKRDRLLVHVHEKLGNAGFDPQHFGRLVVQRHRTRMGERFERARPHGSRDVDHRATYRAIHKSHGRRRIGAQTALERLEAELGIGPAHLEGQHVGRDVGDTRVLGEDEAVEPLRERGGQGRRHFEQRVDVGVDDEHVGDHPPLGRQPGRIAAPLCEDVVGQQAVQPGQAIGAGQAQDSLLVAMAEREGVSGGGVCEVHGVSMFSGSGSEVRSPGSEV